MLVKLGNVLNSVSLSVSLCLIISPTGRCLFRQYMPGKPTRYGIKIWVACDARSSYAWKMQVYASKPDKLGPLEKNLATRVVMDLTEGLAPGRFSFLFVQARGRTRVKHQKLRRNRQTQGEDCVFLLLLLSILCQNKVHTKSSHLVLENS